MPVWDVSTPYISLWLHDEPLGYQPAVGPRLSFKLDFKQRESANGFDTNLFSAGKRWNYSWLSYVTLIQYNTNFFNVMFADGGQRSYYGTNIDYQTNTRLTGNITNGFTLSYPDGSQDVYGLVVTNVDGSFQEALLTQRLNAQSQKTRLNYFAYTPGVYLVKTPIVRLQSVVDGDGRTNWIYYNSTNSYSTNLISQVTDAFGRSAYLAYNSKGNLTNITDVAENSTAIYYDTNNWVTSMTTPYGTTSFAITDSTGTNAPNGRSILITRPDASHELYLAQANAAGVASSYAAGQIPDTAPFTNTLDNGNLNLRNTFHWGPRQYAALSTTNVASFTAADFLKASMQHWLKPAVGAIGQTLSMEREPSVDGAGTIEGQKIWYDYAGKTNSAFEGSQNLPLFAAYVLPDGTTAFTRTERNSLGNVKASVSTYSGGVRTNLFSYANNIDLITATNALGVQVSSNSYNAYHQVLAHFDAVRELTSYTYNTNQQVAGITLPTGLVVTNIYGADNFPAQQIALGFATNSFTWANDLVQTHTDPRGLTTTHTWDNLNRPTSTVFPDASSLSNIYTKLDLTATRDRLGNWTYFGFDPMRRNTTITDALNNLTTFNYCTCGAVESTVDALTNITLFYYDNQGNQTNVSFPDGYSIITTYNLLHQVVNTSDSGGSSVTTTFNNQGLPVTVNNNYGLVASYGYDVLDRVTNSVDANNVTLRTVFDNLNRPTRRTFPDNSAEHWGYTLNFAAATSYTNQTSHVVTYALDALNRKTNEVYVGVTTNQFAYNGAGDLLQITDGRNQTTRFNPDQYGNLTNKMDAFNRVMFKNAFNANGWVTNRWTPEKGDTGYDYDAVGNRRSINYPASSISFAFDANNRLTNMVDEVGTHTFTYTATGRLQSEDGPWPNDTVTLTYAQGLRTALTLSQTSSNWSQSYGHDLAKRLTSLTSPAGTFGYSHDFEPASPLVTGINLPNGAKIVNSYDSLARLTGTALNNHWGHTLDGYTYMPDALGLRTNIVRNLGLASSTVTAGYDAIGQLTAWTASEANGTPRQNEQLGWAYDAANNLHTRNNGNLEQTFTVDAANELTNVSRTGAFTLAGATPAPATSVTVNGLAAERYSDFAFARTNLTLADGSNTFTNIAQNTYGLKATNTLMMNLPQSLTLSFDNNGNLTNDGAKNLSYDVENQLTNVTVANQFKKDFVYDGINRLRIKREFGWTGSAWTQTNEIRFVWDGNVIIQLRDSNNVPTLTLTRGLDLSGSLQGAGGIGGILAMTEGSGANSYFHGDGNGNITALMDAQENIVGRRMYDAFGRTLRLTGGKTGVNPFWFSSQLHDEETDFYHYKHRVYSPALQRWLNQDPIQELGGLNLYAYVGNDPINAIDLLGLALHTLTIQSYILSSSAWGFSGDNHGPTASPSTSYRTSSTITFDDANPNYQPVVLSTTGPTTFARIITAQASSQNLTGSETLLSSGVTQINMQGSASNPILLGLAPPINYNLNLNIDFNQGIVTGNITQTKFPSYQIFLDGQNIYNNLEVGSPLNLFDQIQSIIFNEFNKKHPPCR